MGNLILRILSPVVEAVIKAIFTAENFKKYGDRFFDLIEEVVQDSENKIDDAIVLPVVRRARQLMGIPDIPDDPGGLNLEPEKASA